GAMGGILGPFDSWLLMRGMKTLGIRMDRCQENAREIARWLQKVEAVQEVLYPGVGTPGNSHSHSCQADGPGAIISFRLNEGLSGQRLVESTSVWTLAVSLGAVESIITLPSRMTHLPYPDDELERLGIDDRLVRLSAGIEDVRDLIEDLSGAFDALDAG
ncbi:MAG: PLP-dependent transferase, partial [Planctomycetota bacterium]